MPYRFLEDVATADIAFEAWGADVGELFREAAEATLKVMIDNPEAVEPKVERVIELENDQLDLLLFQFLQELIYYKDAERLLLRPTQVTVAEEDKGYRLRARVSGEALDPARHLQRVDVKAVTLHQFRVAKSDRGWEAFVILDI